MTKSLLMSIQPQWLYKILNGDKTYEVRKVVPKWVLEVLERGETVEAYLYCTKGKPYLINHPYHSYMLIDDKSFDNINGLIPVKVVIDGYVKYVDCSGCTNNENGYECENDFMYLLSDDPILRKATCLTSDEIEEYGNGKDLYALHISKVEILDEVMKIRNFHYFDKAQLSHYQKCLEQHWDTKYVFMRTEIVRPPQNCMSVWVK